MIQAGLDIVCRDSLPNLGIPRLPILPLWNPVKWGALILLLLGISESQVTTGIPLFIASSTRTFNESLTPKRTIPAGLDISVKVNDIIKVDQPLTLDPNVGGFGQNETEIVLQNPNRVKGMIAFFFTVTIAQVLLVIKKKQFEKVQAAEMNF